MNPLYAAFAPNNTRRSIEWPTWMLIAAIYSGWLVLTYRFNVLPWWFTLPAGAWLAAWHMSLQHEILHNHPTKSLRINTVFGFPPLSLWLPYIRYRELHLSHHRDHLLTDPIEDPESYYVTVERWQQTGRVFRTVKRILNTFAGRILFNPLCSIPLFLIYEGKTLLNGSVRQWRIWGIHALGVVAVLFWVEKICGISFWEYIVFFVYPGYSLASIRSFAEHRAAALPAHRTAIVENASVFGLLFLHNNLHVVHHDHPNMPWYKIPVYYLANRDAILRQNNGLFYNGYKDVVRRYLIWEHHMPVLREQEMPVIRRAARLNGKPEQIAT